MREVILTIIGFWVMGWREVSVGTKTRSSKPEVRIKSEARMTKGRFRFFKPDVFGHFRTFLLVSPFDALVVWPFVDGGVGHGVPE